MTKKSHQPHSAIRLGIKSVGIGRRGSKSLEPALIDDILKEIRSGTAPAIAQGAFFGGLIMKGVTEHELALEAAFTPGIFKDPPTLTEALAGDAPDFVKGVCVRLLKGENLSRNEAEELSGFLFSDQPGEGARGMIASILRVRYETPDEYEGLLAGMQKTIGKPFKTPVPAGAPIVQIAEPFDGVDHSNLITPLVADFIRKRGYRVVSLAGRNSGPKFGNNLLDIARAINGCFLKQSSDLTGTAPELGWYLNQTDLSPAVDQWVERRHLTVKRPFLSTLERFINPFNARIMIASAFHPPYGEKMITVCERAGYPGAIIVRNGLEGTLAFPLMRAAKVLCSARQADGQYRREEIVIEPNDYLNDRIALEERLENPSLKKNKELIETYRKDGKTSYDLFDARIKVTCAGLKKAIEWVEKHLSNEP